MGPMDRLYDSDPAKWTKAFQVNVLSHLYTFKYAIPHLRQTEGKVVFTTSDAGRAVFPGWGFYSMSKTAVAFEVQQLHLEEPSLIAIGLRPGLCDTPMLRGVMDGTYEGWSQEDAAAFKNISAGHELIPPKVAAKGFAYAVAKASRALSGFVYDWNDPQIQTLIG
ncbi:uncharacterized protein PV06_04143 [Exophiala oligosperma]|uniref:Uncharacterized protein n=1 Tax=Exophiala oligosperma TaxID=215243 RepID=A0A0D2DS14_9EURO|nr:uncharacterized protein PV06_04143 [Exophiala oligosperma]KIW45788.1 hypothetical protein PV06_04143 [Exophiala oligosperma]